MSSFLSFDFTGLILTAGYAGIFGVVFAESGLFFGFFFPGDSLLFSAGLLASQELLNIWILLPGLALAAILGDNVGYWFGAKAGPAIFTREDSLFFHKSHIERTRKFYEKYGTFTIVLARFVPIVRTFAPIFAGVGQMRYGLFFFYNLLGGVLWSIGVTLAGYFLGTLIPGLKDYLLPISIGIVVVSVLPILWSLYGNKNET